MDQPGERLVPRVRQKNKTKMWSEEAQCNDNALPYFEPLDELIFELMAKICAAN